MSWLPELEGCENDEVSGKSSQDGNGTLNETATVILHWETQSTVSGRSTDVNGSLQANSVTLFNSL